MIKRKGVCDICTKEFELNDGSFAIRIIEDNLNRHSKKWTVTVLSCIEDASDDGFSHVCGKACLYRAMDEFIGRRTEECRFRVIVDNSTDERAIPGHGGTTNKR
ncbi:hypothetical protein [Syntrophorhabdus aromaticivorans]|uniref:Uncharacterized protein n=1 Tax=Syntrophorhabdus aromaticivorans TaxID=328301 RepID=A0A971M2M3_9BACT|nr:hypothetical protein [Syntrophorhabdus aromaticivorans]NLW34544.1 hypothetical protein [Syntrophorhabdus aromaticivorans]